MFLFQREKSPSKSTEAGKSPPTTSIADHSYRRAETLTYQVAPYPFEAANEVFEAMMMMSLDRANQANGGRLPGPDGWLSRAWKGVKQYARRQNCDKRQASFADTFSRQLELNPREEWDVVMVSCYCFMISSGRLHCGILYATNCGIYFCSALESMDSGSDDETDRQGRATAAKAGVELLKDRLLFSDVASILPSVHLQQNDELPPFLMGVPSAIVTPTALQVFTVKDRQVVQFVGIHNVVLKPPEANTTAAAPGTETPPTPPPPPHSVDVLSHSEFELALGLPRALDTLKFCAVLWRLWSQRLEALGLPLENANAQYAEQS